MKAPVPTDPWQGRVAVLVAVTLFAAGCGGSGSGLQTTVRDSAGVTIVENALPAEGAALPWAVSAEPALVIGAAEGAETEQFYQIRGVARLSDGAIAVANAGTRELRVFDAAGEFRGAAGREGGGPGEFGFMSLAGVLAGDSVLLYDVQNRRFSVVSPEPAVARSFTTGPDVGEGSVRALGVLAEGRIVIDGPAPLGDLSAGAVNRKSQALMVLDRMGRLQAVLDTLPGRATFFEREGGFSFTIVPFTLTPPKAVGAHGVYTGTGASYEIRTYDPDTGDLVRLTRLDRPARPVTEADLERGVEGAIERASSPEAGARLRRSYERMPIPDSMPLFQDVEVDRAGYLWVEDYRAHWDEPSVWTVFDPEGAVLGTVRMPDGLTVYEIGEDWILGVERDDVDIPYVVMYGLERPTG